MPYRVWTICGFFSFYVVSISIISYQCQNLNRKTFQNVHWFTMPLHTAHCTLHIPSTWLIRFRNWMYICSTNRRNFVAVDWNRFREFCIRFWNPELCSIFLQAQILYFVVNKKDFSHWKKVYTQLLQICSLKYSMHLNKLFHKNTFKNRENIDLIQLKQDRNETFYSIIFAYLMNDSLHTSQLNATAITLRTM